MESSETLHQQSAAGSNGDDLTAEKIAVLKHAFVEEGDDDTTLWEALAWIMTVEEFPGGTLIQEKNQGE